MSYNKWPVAPNGYTVYSIRCVHVKREHSLFMLDNFGLKCDLWEMKRNIKKHILEDFKIITLWVRKRTSHLIFF